MAQRQNRSDDTDKWIYGFGNGSDDALTISGNTTEAPIDANCSGTSGTTSISATNASFAIGQLILIYQTRGTGATNWELNRIAGYSAGTITTSHNLCNAYSTSGENVAQVRVLKQYTDVTINTGVTYTTKYWNRVGPGGIIGFFAKGKVTVTGIIAANGTNGTTNTENGSTGAGFGGGGASGSDKDGGWAGEGTTRDSHDGDNAYRKSGPNGNGGGSGISNSNTVYGSGGGNGTQGASGTNFVGGAAVGAASLVTMSFGGGGGGNNTNSTPNRCSGASGGGIIAIFAKEIEVTGGIRTNGGAGVGSWGAGGAGGSILLKAVIATLGSNLVTASAGGGPIAGGVGRIHLDYATSYTGTTSPTIDVTKDSTLSSPSANFFAFFN